MVLELDLRAREGFWGLTSSLMGVCAGAANGDFAVPENYLGCCSFILQAKMAKTS